MQTTGLMPPFDSVDVLNHVGNACLEEFQIFLGICGIQCDSATTLGPPPCILRARIVVVRTDTCGVKPL